MPTYKLVFLVAVASVIAFDAILKLISLRLFGKYMIESRHAAMDVVVNTIMVLLLCAVMFGE